MKYTPEELYEYCEENGLLLSLDTVTHNNREGHLHFLSKGTVIELGDGKFAIHSDSLDGGNIDLVKEEANDEILHAIKGKEIPFAIRVFNKEYSIFLPTNFGDKEDDMVKKPSRHHCY